MFVCSWSDTSSNNNKRYEIITERSDCQPFFFQLSTLNKPDHGALFKTQKNRFFLTFSKFSNTSSTSLNFTTHFVSIETETSGVIILLVLRQKLVKLFQEISSWVYYPISCVFFSFYSYSVKGPSGGMSGIVVFVGALFLMYIIYKICIAPSYHIPAGSGTQEPPPYGFRPEYMPGQGECLLCEMCTCLKIL